MTACTLELNLHVLSLPISLLPANSCETQSKLVSCSIHSFPFFPLASSLSMKKRTACFMQQICSADLYNLTEINNFSVAAKMGNQYKSMWQNIFTIFSLKNSLFLLQCLMLKLQSWSLSEEMPSIRNVSALCSGDIPLLSGYVSTYNIFDMTSPSFSTLGCLIWEGIGLRRRKLLWVNCQQCHWCGCHGRSSKCLVDKTERCFAGETDALFLVWATAEPTQTSLSITHCMLYFFAVDSICGSAEHAYLEGKSVGATHWISKML